MSENEKAADPDATSMVTPARHVDPDKTQIVTPPPSGAEDRTRVVTPPPVAPAPQTSWQPPSTPPPAGGQTPHGQWTPPPAAAPPPAPPTTPVPPPAPPVPPAPPGASFSHGSYPAAGQPAAPPPSFGASQAPGAAPPQWPGAPGQPGPSYPGAQYPGAGPAGFPGAGQPNTPPQSPSELASNLVAKGNSILTRLMQRGMRGELISQAWFQPFRQSPDTFMTVSYIVVAVLALGLSYGGGLIGNIFTLALWAALAYVFFAIGSLRAHKLVAYGIGYGGAVIALIGILEPIKLIIDLSSYSVPSLSVGLVIDIVIAVVVAALLGLFGVLVSKEIKRLSTNPF